jgi:hypothetical protein
MFLSGLPVLLNAEKDVPVRPFPPSFSTPV